MNRKLLESFNAYSEGLEEGLFDDIKSKISKAKEDHTYKKNQKFRNYVNDATFRQHKETMWDAGEIEKEKDKRQRQDVDLNNESKDPVILMRFFTDYFQHHKKDLLYTEIDETPKYENCSCMFKKDEVSEEVDCVLEYPTEREAEIRLNILRKDLDQEFEKFLKNYKIVKDKGKSIAADIFPSSKKNDTTCKIKIFADLTRSSDAGKALLIGTDGKSHTYQTNNTPWKEEVVDVYKSTIKEDGQEKPFDVKLIKQPGDGSRNIHYIVQDTKTGKTLKDFFTKHNSDSEVVNAFKDWCDAMTSKVFEVSSPSKEFVLVKVQNSNGNSNKPIVFCIQDKNNSYFRMQINTNNENEARTAFNDWMNDNKQFEFGSCNKVPSELQNFYDSGQNEFVLCRERGVDNEFVVCNNNADFDPHTFKQGAKENIIKFKGPYPRAEKEYIDWFIRASKRKQERNSKKKKR